MDQFAFEIKFKDSLRADFKFHVACHDRQSSVASLVRSQLRALVLPVSFPWLSGQIFGTQTVQFQYHGVLSKYIFKNRLTKHRLACTYFDVFFMLIPNMDIKFNNSEIFGVPMTKNDAFFHACTAAWNVQFSLLFSIKGFLPTNFKQCHLQ